MNYIEHTIVSRVFAGDFRDGDRLPSERILAKEFGCTQAQVRKALRALVDKGMLRCLRGSGYFVSFSHESGRKKKHVALLAGEDIDNPHTGVPLKYLMHEVQHSGWALTPYFVDKSEDAFEFVFGQIYDSYFKGVFILPTCEVIWCDYVAKALLSHFPFIFLHRAQIPGTFSCVESNHFEGGFRAAQELARYGYKRPMFLGYTERRFNVVPTQRIEGFIEGCKTFGLNEPAMCLYDNVDQTCIEHDLCKAFPKQCDSVFAASTAFTTRVATWMVKNKITPSHTFGVIGMDNIRPLPGFDYEVNCIIQDRERESHEAISLLNELSLNRGSSIARSLLIPPRYIEGTTLVK